MAAALRRSGFLGPRIGWLQRTVRSGNPRIAGPLVLSSGCRVHDGFQMLSGLSDAPALGFPHV